MKFFCLFSFFCLLSSLYINQQASAQTDTILPLKAVVVRSYFSEQPVLRSPASASVVESAVLSVQPPASLLPAVNTVPGVRMEERSPGSYRFSIRGSLLRSPFGIRNVKIYIDELPFTDAGGNTYLNLLDASSVNRIEVLKGPDGSVFGANSGGVVRINPFVKNTDSLLVSASLGGGSYGMFHESITAEKQWKKYRAQVSQSFYRSDGYRQNSALNRNALHTSQQWNYSSSGQLRALLIYSQLNYQTPGGLTLQQMEEDPRAARPAAGNTPGAAEQKAGIENKTFYGGLINEIKIGTGFRHIIAVGGTFTDFKNPFITNYEFRTERNGALRTFMEFYQDKPGWKLNWQAGLESSMFTADIYNYDNHGGTKGLLQSSDALTAGQTFLFTHFSAAFQRWFLEAAASLNAFNYHFESLSGGEVSGRRTFKKQLMPRLAASYQLGSSLFWRASVSRGYSPPTIAEVRPSGNVINLALQAETGWNVETGIRFRTEDGHFYVDAAVFNYNLHNAIVRRVGENDQEYFINSGGTRQPGFEFETMFRTFPASKLLKEIELSGSYALSDFSFAAYKNAFADFSGNKLTGVPRHAAFGSLLLKFPIGVYLSAGYNFTSKIPLNDANTVFAASYHLLRTRAGLKKYIFRKKSLAEVYAGADNLLNEKYSLGNDLNAFGGRYYNPAPQRNIYLGLSILFK